MAESHIRIDEGIKRGPRKPQEGRRRAPKADLGTWIIPPDLNPHKVIQRFLTESTTGRIAQEYGLSRKALVKWLRQEVPIEWKEAQVIRALCRKDDGDEGIDLANDALSLAQAREQLKSAQWDLERLDSRNYGQKQEVTVKTEERIELVLEGNVQALIDRIRTVQSVQSLPITVQPIDNNDKTDLT